VLPDGVTHTKGFVKDPDQARRYLSVTGGDPPSEFGSKGDMDHLEVTERPEDRKRVDLTKNVQVFPISLDKVISCLFFFFN
jgi:actin-related protein 6